MGVSPYISKNELYGCEKKTKSQKEKRLTRSILNIEKMKKTELPLSR